MSFHPTLDQSLPQQSDVGSPRWTAAEREILAVFSMAPGPCVVTIGTFDGVHEGHRAVLATALLEARTQGFPLVAATFDPRPERVFNPEALPDLYDSIDERVAKLHEAGADHVCVLPFNMAVAAIDDTSFVRLLLVGLRARLLVVGDDFHLGCGRTGTPDRIARLGLPTKSVALVRDHDGVKVSSTALRFARLHEGKNR